MYARLVLFTLGSGMRLTAEKVMGRFPAGMRAAKGFKGVTFLGDDTTGQYGALVLWESKGDAEAHFEVAFPQLQSALEGIAKAPPTATLFEVVELKA